VAYEQVFKFQDLQVYASIATAFFLITSGQM